MQHLRGSADLGSVAAYVGQYDTRQNRLTAHGKIVDVSSMILLSGRSGVDPGRQVRELDSSCNTAIAAPHLLHDPALRQVWSRPRPSSPAARQFLSHIDRTYT